MELKSPAGKDSFRCRLPLFLVVSATHAAGQAVLTMTASVWAWKLTGSALATGTPIILSLLPAVVGSLLGTAVDLTDRRLTVSLGAGTKGVLVAWLYASAGHVSVAWIGAVVFLAGLANAVYSPAGRSVMPWLVPRDRMLSGNALVQLVKGASAAAGLAASSAVIGRLGVRPALGLSAALFTVSALLAWTLPRMRAEPSNAAWAFVPRLQRVASYTSELVRGFSELAGNPVLRRVVLLMGLEMLAAGPFIAFSPIYVEAVIRRPAEAAGLLLSAQQLGGAISAAVLSWRSPNASPIGWIPRAMLGIGLSCAALVVFPHWPGPLLYFFLLGVAVTGKSIGDETALQTYGQASFRGRFFAAQEAFTAVTQVLSVTAGGVLLATLRVRWLFTLAVVLQLLAAAYGFVRLAPLARPKEISPRGVGSLAEPDP